MTFGETMYKSRTNRKISRKDFGKLIGVSRYTVFNIESGKNNSTFERALHIAALLGLDLNQFKPDIKPIELPIRGIR